MNNNRFNNENPGWGHFNPDRGSNPERLHYPQHQLQQKEEYNRYGNRSNYEPEDTYYRNNFQPDRNNFNADADYYQPRNSRENYNPYGQNNLRNESYGASLNYGSMGSYGGAQGYGSAQNGYSNDGWGSGHRGANYQPRHAVYGAYRDHNSFAEGEKESYDGSQRYGSQGADSTKGWAKTKNESAYRKPTFENRNTYSRGQEDDSRYEIYDTALSQYNRGDYSNSTHGSVSGNFNQRSHQDLAPRYNYGSLQRGLNRQGSGSDLDMNMGTSDLEYGNTAGALNGGNPDYRGSDYPESHYYDSYGSNFRNLGW